MTLRPKPEVPRRPTATLVRHDDGGLVWYEARGAGWRAAFSTRLGGFSAAPFDSLNLGISTADDPACVRRNRAAFAAAAGFAADDLVVAGQVHGTAIAEVGRGQRGRGAHGPSDVVPETDGLLTRTAGVPLFVSFADCVPVLLSALRAPLAPPSSARASGPAALPSRPMSASASRRFSRAPGATGVSTSGRPLADSFSRPASPRPTSSRAGCAPVMITSSSRTVANTARPADRRPSPGYRRFRK